MEKTAAGKPIGRPSNYSPELAATILCRIAEGESLRSICRDESMPCQTAVYAWLLKHDDFAKQYARSRDEQADTYADEIAFIADDESIPADSRRIRIDARKWIACKLKPKKYGEKVSQEHTGADGGPIAFAEVKRSIVDPKGEK